MLMENLVAIEQTSALYLIIEYSSGKWTSDRIYFGKPRARLLILSTFLYYASTFIYHQIDTKFQMSRTQL